MEVLLIKSNSIEGSPTAFNHSIIKGKTIGRGKENFWTLHIGTVQIRRITNHPSFENEGKISFVLLFPIYMNAPIIVKATMTAGMMVLFRREYRN